MCVILGRRNNCSWEELISQHHPGAGRRIAFWNAGVLLKMVDYACRAEKPIDAALAEALRTEAMRVRFAAILVPIDWA
jgi:hypothetical protein